MGRDIYDLGECLYSFLLRYGDEFVYWEDAVSVASGGIVPKSALGYANENSRWAQGSLLGCWVAQGLLGAVPDCPWCHHVLHLRRGTQSSHMLPEPGDALVQVTTHSMQVRQQAACICRMVLATLCVTALPSGTFHCHVPNPHPPHPPRNCRNSYMGSFLEGEVPLTERLCVDDPLTGRDVAVGSYRIDLVKSALQKAARRLEALAKGRKLTDTTINYLSALFDVQKVSM